MVAGPPASPVSWGVADSNESHKACRKSAFTSTFSTLTDFDTEDHWGSVLVVRENNPLRVVWSLVVFGLLVYVATIFLYRFAFRSFRLGATGLEPVVEPGFWQHFDDRVDILFWLDLFVNFFFSYRTHRGVEVDSLPCVAMRYLRGYFWINLVACLPGPVGKFVVLVLSSNSQVSDSNSEMRWTRLARLQRITQLTKLFRLVRLLKCSSAMSNSPFLRWLNSLRGVRIVNFTAGLLFSVHLLACGWYLCAALEEDGHTTSWVARRKMGDPDASLLDSSPLEQWMNACYFVLTVFTTVGFGDIAAATSIEIIYVIFTMLMGAVVHSIIISEVIQVVTSTDKLQEYTDRQLRMVDAFCQHAQLPQDARSAMRDEIRHKAQHYVASSQLDKSNMQQLLAGKALSQKLLGTVTRQLFDGKLLQNQLLLGCLAVPPRLPCTLAMHLRPCEFTATEIVYQMHDFATNLFLVQRGTFAHVGLPSPKGGVDMNIVMDNSRQNSNLHARLKASRSGRHLPAHRSSSTASLGVELDRSPGGSGMFFPYMLLGRDNYFGETELFSGSPRLSTVRCEAYALALALHHGDFGELRSQFPQFGAHWRHVACRREWSREQARSRLTLGRNYRRLAALRILTRWREKRACRDFADPSQWSEWESSGWPQRSTSETRIMDTVGKHVAHTEAAKNSEVKHPLKSFQTELQRTREDMIVLRVDVAGLRQDMQQILRCLGGSPDPSPGPARSPRSPGCSPRPVIGLGSSPGPHPGPCPGPSPPERPGSCAASVQLPNSNPTGSCAETIPLDAIEEERGASLTGTLPI